MIIERSLNNAARAIRNDFALKVLEMEEKGATLDELFPLLTGSRVKQSYISGDISDAIFHCGQTVGLANEILSAQEIIDGIIREAEKVGQRLRHSGIPV